MRRRTWILVLFVFCGGCGSRSNGVTDPIADLPLNQQRTIARSEFDWRWPLTVGQGTVGCDGGAVVFRSGNVTYSLNEAARAKGFAPVTPLQATVQSAAQNPLPQVRQDTRMQIFAQAVGCDRTAATSPTTASACRQRLRDAHQLSDDQLKQIEAEGAQRRWPPLAPEYRSLAPVLEAGLKLCTA